MDPRPQNQHNTDYKKPKAGEQRAMDTAETFIRAFSPEHAAKLTGLSVTQLRYWNKTGFFRPEHTSGDSQLAVYSFQDVVGLKTLGLLRHKWHVSLQHLRQVAHQLVRYRNAPWATLKLHILKKKVQFVEPDTGKVRGVLNKQYVLIKLEDIAHDMSADIKKLTQREPQQIGKVERHRKVAHNEWVIAGTRIPTKAILHYHEAGYSPAAIVREYPLLKETDVQAAVSHERRRERQLKRA